LKAIGNSEFSCII